MPPASTPARWNSSSLTNLGAARWACSWAPSSMPRSAASPRPSNAAPIRFMARSRHRGVDYRWCRRMTSDSSKVRCIFSASLTVDWLKQARNDVVGGLVSAAIAIPLAMGYGMFAFASLGEDYFADGALAGLAAALVVAVVCVLLGDRTTTVYAPRVNSTFFLGLLIYGLVHSDAPELGAGGGPLILAIAFSVIFLGGALEALFGFVKLGTLIKFAPQPVMAGFQNAAALLLFLVQLGNVCAFDRNIPFMQVPEHWASIKPLSVIIAMITFSAMWNARKI